MLRQDNTMTTRELSRTVVAALATLAEKTTAFGASAPSVPPPRRAAAAPPTSPYIERLSPALGSSGGSTPLRIDGSGFQPGAEVFIDGIAISAFVLDSQTIYA